MFAKSRLACLLLLAAVFPACSTTETSRATYGIGPDPDQMRAALQAMLRDHPDLSIPEFQISLDSDRAITRNGMVYIGAWNCDPKLMSFGAVFSAPNIPFYEVSGSFQTDARGLWHAVPRHVQLTQKHDIGVIWRASDVDPYHN